ncbi:MAG: cell division protein FtsA [Bryobacteraceae bacterium]|jgi:cell division protein FtsA
MPEKPIYAVGLDAGSTKTRMVVCAIEDELRLLGCAEVESRGWSKGTIKDQRAVAESIRAALEQAELSAGVSVESVVVGMGGPGMRGAAGRGVLELGYPREIQQRDVNRVKERAARVQLQEDRMVLQLFPQDFVVDDHPGHRDPRKMTAARLELNVHLLTASAREHDALVGAVNQAHLVVEETIFEAQAAWYAAVKPEERSAGVALVDIGAESTSLVVYYGEAMCLASTVRVCGSHFTSDLASGLKISPAEAEQVKIEYGRARAADSPENVLVELPVPENCQPRQAPKRHVDLILDSRARDLFQLVRSELARVSMDQQLLGGVFLVGGGARLAEILDVAAEELKCQSRWGIAEGIANWPKAIERPEWCTAAGLAMYSAKLKAQAERQRASMGWLNKIL